MIIFENFIKNFVNDRFSLQSDKLTPTHRKTLSLFDFGGGQLKYVGFKMSELYMFVRKKHFLIPHQTLKLVQTDYSQLK